MSSSSSQWAHTNSHHYSEDIDLQLKIGKQIIDQMQSVIVGGGGTVIHSYNSSNNSSSSSGINRDDIDDLNDEDDSVHDDDFNDFIHGMRASQQPADRESALRALIRQLTQRVAPHPAITKRFLALIHDNHSQLTFQENQHLIQTVAQIVSCSGGGSSTDGRHAEGNDNESSIELQWTLDLFTNVMHEDRSLIPCVIGTVYELPLDEMQKRKISSVIVGVLDIVDEDDVPALIRTLLKTMTRDNGIGNKGKGKQHHHRHEGLLSSDDIIRAIRMQQYHNTGSAKNLALLCEVLNTALSVNPVAAQAFVRSIRATAASIMRGDWTSDLADPPVSEFDIVLLLVLLKRNRYRKIIFNCINELYQSGALKVELLLRTIANKHICHDLEPSIYALCVYMFHNKHIFIQKPIDDRSGHVGESNFDVDDMHVSDDDDDDHEEHRSYIKRGPLRQRQSVPWAYHLFINTFRLYPDLQVQLLTCLLASMLPSPSESTPFEQNQDCLASNIIVGMCLDDTETMTEEGGSSPSSCEILASYSNLLEESLHNSHNLAVKCIHRLCFVLCRCSAYRNNIKQNMITFLRKQLFSGQDMGANIGIITASHIIHYTASSGSSVESQRECVQMINWILQVFHTSSINSNTAFILDMLNHNDEFLRRHPDLRNRIHGEYLIPLALGVGLFHDNAGFIHTHPHRQQSQYQQEHSVIDLFSAGSNDTLKSQSEETELLFIDENRSNDSCFTLDCFLSNEHSVSFIETLYVVSHLVISIIKLSTDVDEALEKLMRYGYRIKTSNRNQKSQFYTLISMYIISSSLCRNCTADRFKSDSTIQHLALRSLTITLFAKFMLRSHSSKVDFRRIMDKLFHEVRPPLYLVSKYITTHLFCNQMSETGNTTDQIASGFNLEEQPSQLDHEKLIREVERYLKDRMEEQQPFFLEKEALQLLWDHVQVNSSIFLDGGSRYNAKTNITNGSRKDNKGKRRKKDLNSALQRSTIGYDLVDAFDHAFASFSIEDTNDPDTREWMSMLLDNKCIEILFGKISELVTRISELRMENRVRSAEMNHVLQILGHSLNIISHLLFAFAQKDGGRQFRDLVTLLSEIVSRNRDGSDNSDDCEMVQNNSSPFEIVTHYFISQLDKCDELHTRILLGVCAAVLARNSHLQALVASEFISLLERVPILISGHLSSMVYNCQALKTLFLPGTSLTADERVRLIKTVMRHIFQLPQEAVNGHSAINVETSLMTSYCQQVLLVVPLCLLPKKIGGMFLDNILLCLHDLADDTLDENNNTMARSKRNSRWRDITHNMHKNKDSYEFIVDESEGEENEDQTHGNINSIGLRRTWERRLRRIHDTRIDVERGEHSLYRMLNRSSLVVYMEILLHILVFAISRDTITPLVDVKGGCVRFPVIEEAISRLSRLVSVYHDMIFAGTLSCSDRFTTIVLKQVLVSTDLLQVKWGDILRYRYTPLENRRYTSDNDHDIDVESEDDVDDIPSDIYASPSDLARPLNILFQFVDSCKRMCTALDTVSQRSTPLFKNQQSLLFKLTFKTVQFGDFLAQEQYTHHIPRLEPKDEDESNEDSEHESDIVSTRKRAKRNMNPSAFQWRPTWADKDSHHKQFKRALRDALEAKTGLCDQSFINAFLTTGYHHEIDSEQERVSDLLSSNERVTESESEIGRGSVSSRKGSYKKKRLRTSATFDNNNEE